VEEDATLIFLTVKTSPGFTVKKINVASSSTEVILEETGDLGYELGWFDIID